jgi:arginase
MIGLPGTLGKLGCEVVDHGDLLPAVSSDPASVRTASVRSDERSRRRSELAAWVQCLSRTAYEFARGGNVPVFLGGDHSLAMGTIDGIARACTEKGNELYVLWLDAHPDFNTPATSPSGNLHGMSLAFLCGEPGFEPVLALPARKTVDPSKVFLFGIRSVDAREGEVIQQREVNVVDMREITQHGVVASVQRILDTVAAHEGVLHVSLDADFVDPAFIPAVNVPVASGLTYAEALLIMEMLRESDLVVSLDVAELNPTLDADGRSARAIAGLVACLFDRNSEGRHDYSRNYSRRESRYDHDSAQVH